MRHLVFRLRNAELTARPSKCFIGCHKLDSLGHLVSAGRLEPYPDKLKAIADAPRPETKRKVRSFLGLIGLYWRFVPNFSQMAATLTDATKNVSQIE